MTLNRAKIDIIQMRRERVGQLRLRGLSIREIATALANGNRDGSGKMINPETGAPFTHGTIAGDLKALKAEWRESRGAATDEHIDRQFAEMQEIKRAGWSSQDPELVLKTLDKEMKLLGTAKDKDGFNLNINLELIVRIVEVGESLGYTASELFEGMLRRLENAKPK